MKAFKNIFNIQLRSKLFSNNTLNNNYFNTKSNKANYYSILTKSFATSTNKEDDNIKNNDDIENKSKKLNLKISDFRDFNSDDEIDTKESDYENKKYFGRNNSKNPVFVSIKEDNTNNNNEERSNKIVEESSIDFSKINTMRAGGRNKNKKPTLSFLHHNIFSNEISLNIGNAIKKEIEDREYEEMSSIVPPSQQEDTSQQTDIVSSNKQQHKEFFSDKCRMYFKAGDGGNGSYAFYKGVRPDGGSGGKGGDVVLIADKSVKSFSILRKRHFYGNNGESGKGRSYGGKKGCDLEVSVPIGTIVYDIIRLKKDTSKKSDLRKDMPMKKKFIIDLDEPGKRFVLAKGGEGGIGNKDASKLIGREKAEYRKGRKGQEKEVELELKVKSDVCLVGYPNAGKSTLISALTQSMPKIASYEFTTMHPHIGKIVYDDYKEIIVEDLPGLIEGASDNKGLGHRFLKHIDRAKLLVFILDGSNYPSWKRSPVNDFKSLKTELQLYDPKLNKKPYLVLLNKKDLADTAIYNENKEKVKELLAGENVYLLEISAKCGDNLKTLVDLLRHLIIDQKL